MSPRRREQNEEMRAERRQQILDAAIPLFARQGFDPTSVSQIAREAGLSHGTIFLYFTTKEALFHAAVMEPLTIAEEQYQRILLGEGTPLERIRRMIREQLFLFARRNSSVRLVQSVLAQAERFPDLVQEIHAFSGRYADLICPLIEEGQRRGELAPGEPRSIAFAYFAYLNGVPMIVDPPGFPGFEETVSWFVKLGLRLFAPLKEDDADVADLPG